MSRRNFFRLNSSVLDEEKKVFLKTNKLESDFGFWILDFGPQQKTLNIENSRGYPPAEVRPRPRKQCVNFFTNSFFFKIPDLVHRPTTAPIAAENRR